MRKVVVIEFVTLDGVMEGPGNDEHFEHSGWTGAYRHPDIGAFQYEGLFGSDALLLGRVTYEGFAAAWPEQQDEAGFADRMNNLPKYVVSTTLTEVTWNNSRLISGDTAEAVRKLKEEDGQNILIYGSATLVRSLMEADLVDEYRLLLFPIVLGSGKGLFTEGSPKQDFKLVEAKPFGSGVVALTYQREPQA